jgi:hypothetical protein
MRRVDRVGDKAAVTALEVLGEATRHDGRCRRREDRIRRRQAIELGKHLPLELEDLGEIFLHERGTGERVGDACGHAHALGGRRGVGEAVVGELM